MVRPNTRPKNANQHPGEILLQNKRKRRTARQIQEDNDQAEHERQEKEAADQRTTEKIASIEDKKALKDLKILLHAPKPRPRARPVSKSKVSQPNIEDDEEIVEAAEMGDVEMEDVAAGDNDGDKDFQPSEEENEEVQPRNKRVQKTAYREAVHAERSVNNTGINMTHNQNSKVDISDQADPTARGDQKGKKGVVDVCAAKDDYAGMGKTKDWAEKLATSKLLRPQLESLRTESHRRVSSITTSTAVSRISKVTSARANPTGSPHPTNNVQGNLEEPTTAFLDEDDSLEREAAFKATKKPGARHTTSADILEVSDNSLSPPPLRPKKRSPIMARTESLSSPPPRAPPSTQPSRATARFIPTEPVTDLSTDIDFGESEDTSPPPAPVSAKGTKRLTTSTGVSINSQPPPSKRAKTEPQSKSVTSRRDGSGANHRYQNDDLPERCQDGNTWRRVFIPTVAHWAGGEVEPWGPEDEDLRDAMQEIWNYIYRGKIQHEISRSGAVLKVAKQRLMEWRGGFGIAACSILTAFFAQDADFLDPAAREDFSRAMLKHNRFIFRDNSGLIPKDWTGMWRSPFVLQTFASHLNFTFGRVEVPNLDTESISARAAFALAVTAVYRTLQLIIDGNLTFEVIQESRGKRKGAKTDGGDIWTPIITKGEQFAFSKPIWGHMTVKLMGPIVALSDNAFASIVGEAQQYAKHAKSIGNSRTTTSEAPDEDDVFADLFAFR
ncbi:hypothetical protein DEU56DRAFT_917080 [Suillus clintonianus]|uniref:uncharacterized protein n=1 Tax=Suillus clintonianus TaxID=1904413 RepID=UPI001B86C746|nr:uncharacterized protein DEU56DRAFT_917080 [Suillus clintonianus]KAG2124207.1 hypothetical protein DEU56DRAFT_917080 [Suillus clintonianus]